jgi:hypothetical protein
MRAAMTNPSEIARQFVARITRHDVAGLGLLMTVDRR